MTTSSSSSCRGCRRACRLRSGQSAARSRRAVGTGPCRTRRSGGRFSSVSHRASRGDMAASIRASVCAGLVTGVLIAVPQAQTPSWKEAAFLKAPMPGEGEQFGGAVAVSADGSTLIVGAPMDGHGGYGSGAAYVYTRRGDRWTQQAFLKASNAGSDDQFGNAVAVSADGNTLAVAAVYEDS